jgi:hypothetical protein
VNVLFSARRTLRKVTRARCTETLACVNFRHVFAFSHTPHHTVALAKASNQTNGVEGYMFEETIGYPSPIPSPCKPQKKKRSAKAPTRQVALAAKKQRGPNTSPTVSSVSGGAFTQRRVSIGIHTLIPNADATIGNNHRCAVCWYDKPIEGAVGHVEQAIRKNSRVRCGHCMVYMCLDCWPRWHS